MLPALGDGVSDARGTHEALRPWQRPLHDDRTRKIDDPDDEKCLPPRKMMGHHSGDISSQKAAQYRPRNVRGHCPTNELPRKLLIDVRHDDDDHPGHEHPLHEAPEDELMQVLRSRRQQGWGGQRVKRWDDDLLAADGLRQQSDERRGQRHRQDGGAHRQRDRNFRGIEDLLQIRKQRLRVIHVQERAHSREHAGDNGGPRRRAVS